MTPKQARAARAMLNLDMREVCELAEVGKRTLTEFESGKRSINNVTEGKLRAFYLTRGVTFGSSGGTETVAHLPALVDHSPDTPRAKTEQRDVARVGAIAEDVRSLLAFVERVKPKCAISRNLILYVMQSRGLNQKQLADLLHSSPAFVSAITRGEKRLPLSHITQLKSLCTDLDVDFEALVQFEKKMAKELASLDAALTDAMTDLCQLLQTAR